MRPPLEMALSSAKARCLAVELRARGLLLITTCLRTEVYGECAALTELSRGALWDREPKLIKNSFGVTQRLAEIASGIHSQIVGEDYIAQQLDRALEEFDQHSPVYQLARFAIDIGVAAKERYGLRAELSYDRIVRRLLSDLLGTESAATDLYVVGAGMLGRQLLRSGIAKDFRRFAMVTRNPKTLRRRLRSEGIECSFVKRPGEVAGGRQNASAVVIATSEVTSDYACKLSDMVQTLQPRVIIDLSSVPVPLSSKVHAKAIDMYGPAFASLVSENNAAVASKIPDVQQAIRSNLEFAVTHLRSAA